MSGDPAVTAVDRVLLCDVVVNKCWDNVCQAEIA